MQHKVLQGFYTFVKNNLQDQTDALTTETRLRKEYDEKIATFTPGKNLYNPDDVETGFLNFDGSILTDSGRANYETTGYIQVETSTQYMFETRTDGSLNTARKLVLAYDASKNVISDSYKNEQAKTYSYTTPASAAFVRCSTVKANTTQFEKGTSVTSYEAFNETASLKSTLSLTSTMDSEVDSKINEGLEPIDDLQNEIAKIATFTLGKNLFNPDTDVIGGLANDGTIQSGTSAWDAYRTTGYIPVEESDNFTLSTWNVLTGNEINVRKIMLCYDSSRNPIETSYVNEIVATHTITIPEGAAFLRVSSPVDGCNVQLEKSSSRTSYEAYHETGNLNNNIGLNSKMENEVIGIVKSFGKISASIHNNAIVVVSDIGDKKLKQTCSYGFRNNNTFEFDNAYIVENNIETLIKSCNDDITPLRLGWNTGSYTIGANHGWPSLKTSKGSLTAEDVGSTWSDGSKIMTLALVSGNYAYFVYPCSMSDGVFICNNTVPVNNLTHVDGAIHTSEVSVSGASNEQLYPSVNNRTVEYFADNDKIRTDGEYKCDEFLVVEKYSIIDYALIAEYIHDNIGTGIDDNAPVCIDICISYKFKGSSCIIGTSLTAKKDIIYVNCGIIQASPIEIGNGNNRYFYVNNIASGNTLDSSQLYNSTSSTSQLDATYTQLIDNAYPVNRAVEITKNSQGTPLFAFTHGFFPDVSKAGDEYRILNHSRQWEFRGNTNKSYPVAIADKSVQENDFGNYIAYRNYYIPDVLTNQTILETEFGTYIIIDAHETLTNYKLNIGNKYFGKEIEVIDPYHFILSSSIVGPDGIVFSVSNGYGCAILKIQ